MINGILLLDKKTGITSYDAIRAIKFNFSKFCESANFNEKSFKERKKIILDYIEQLNGNIVIEKVNEIKKTANFNEFKTKFIALEEFPVINIDALEKFSLKVERFNSRPENTCLPNKKIQAKDIKIYPALKIGHAGTLDPFASGLLVILLGKATKKFNEFQSLKKTYCVTAEFGYATNTLDIDGKIIDSCMEYDIAKINEEQIEDMIKDKFFGEIDQMPPKFSAKKVNGKRAYDLAREGIDFKLQKKKVHVYKFKLQNLRETYAKTVLGKKRIVSREAEFVIECSSGCYIRSLISDLAIELGVFATTTKLRRVSIGDYEI